MIDANLLLTDAKKQVLALVTDLRTVAAADPAAQAHVAEEYQRARAAGRTAFGPAEWAEGLYDQVAVAWVLSCVFVRFCEDNDLITDPLLGGPGIRTQIALDHRAAYLQVNPSHDDRHWLREVFSRLRSLPATGAVFGNHNPIWADDLLPSADAARKLREAVTGLDPESGQLRHDFTDPTWDTRFLGDLYQDLSEHAKKTYALLQTPRFVEAFILDRTLDPAIATFGLADTTIIDPTCGSGHFLLGAFDRLFARWAHEEPATNRRVLTQRALSAIGGIDLNPFAASITRFRLLVAALRSGGDTRLRDAPSYVIRIAVGDSLLHGEPPGRLPGLHVSGEEEALVASHGYEAEDVEAVRDLLGSGWGAVVGNPPYITVKDPALNAAYRSRFETCHRQYSLGVPFTERFWQLARYESGRPDRSGYIGIITANSFMKREFGKKLVERWFPVNDLTYLVDTSGAYVPGHGTPTVILLGRNRPPVSATLRAVMGIRGEPSRPADPEKGLVWSSIVALVDEPGRQSDYVSVENVERDRFARHPWSIGGGGAAELKEVLSRGRTPLGTVTHEIGFGAVTRGDDVFRIGRAAALRSGVSVDHVLGLVAGEELRDWSSHDIVEAIWPYDPVTLEANLASSEERALWPWKRQLSERVAYGTSQIDRGLQWWEYSMFFRDRFREPLSIAFAFVATHNHFVLDRGGKVFKQTAPVIKLRADANEVDHFELLGALNSSVACFWMKQVLACKGNGGIGGGIKGNVWDRGWEFDGTKLARFPLVAGQPSTDLARRLDSLGSDLATQQPSFLCATATPTQSRLDAARVNSELLFGEMVAAQEELDWTCLHLYEVTNESLVVPPGETPPPLALGERAFEIVLARQVMAGEAETVWFARHRSAPITVLPSHWPGWYKELVQSRIALIETDLNIGLIETSEHKRRWSVKPWAEKVEAALRLWLLDRLESPRYWREPAVTTVARLTAEARADGDFVSVARLWVGREDLDLAAVIDELVKAEAVPYLATLRFTRSGLRRHAEWLRTWELQRRQDVGEDVGAIPVPPQYEKPDFTGTGWTHRGKLDVPKERFITYPGAERETDASLVIGWAGWDHLARARALASWYLQARRDGRDKTHLTPLLAGLAELVPWLKQWYDNPNPDPALDRPGSQIAALLDTELRSLSLTAEDLISWRPEAKRAGRGRKATR